MRLFYITFPNVYKSSDKSEKIGATVSHLLSWSHIILIITLKDEKKRNFYIEECAASNWSVRQLSRQIKTGYYDRLLSTQMDGIVKEENKEGKNEISNINPLSLLKTLYVLEFLGLGKDYSEKDLENKIIDELQLFLLEMGRGFQFVARQKRITIDRKHYYIDLVFYNAELKCYVLIDLKKKELNHKDLGQMDFYVRYFENKVKKESDNPTLGIIMCSEKNNAMVEYTMLEGNEQIFASKYMTILPTEKELRDYLMEQRKLLEKKYLEQ
ncbi:hypothetical protein FACS1894152_5030 [Bacilli bacterium]|nr:hypothetical protein FACS1894152_5030 [Bacilli bacterium]